MVRKNSSSRNDLERDTSSKANLSSQARPIGFDIQRELERLEELVIASFHIWLTQWTLVDESRLLNQLDLVRLNLPDAFEEALKVIDQKQEILERAENYAQDIIQRAQQRAAEILDETGIIQRAQLEASQIRQQVQQECEAIQGQTLAEIEQMRYVTEQELTQMRQQTIAECDQIQQGADEYADQVLNRIEQQLSDMLRVVQNGRQQLYSNSQNRSLPAHNPARQSGIH